jgi:alginate O-acetyltransferase complex protein AlgI
VAGSIVRAKDFTPQIRLTPELSNNDFAKVLFLIICGVFKKVIISDYISTNFVDRVFDNPSLYTGLENLFAVYGYAIQIYADFSGYTDIAIGVALLLGFHLPVNFDAPYVSSSITEFWRRWHISLSTWLKDYLYIPLGGNRHGKFRQYLNQFLTMLLGGLWHGASFNFILWGALHDVALGVDKFVKDQFKLNTYKWNKVLGVIVTFHFVCFCWILFRA